MSKKEEEERKEKEKIENEEKVKAAEASQPAIVKEPDQKVEELAQP